MQIVDPADKLRCLNCRDVEVVDQTPLSASRQHAMKLQIVARIDLLMWNETGGGG
jgi:hypothetical protein